MKSFNLLFFVFNLLTTFWINIGVVQGIVGGKEIEIDQFKFMVSVQANGNHVCGGCIISNEFVITAAQCVIGPNKKFRNKKFTVLAGVNDLKLQEPMQITSSVEIIYVPSEYETLKTDSFETGDIALLKLKQSLDNYTNSILRIVALPERSNTHRYSIYFYTKPIMIGYGTNVGTRGVKRDRENFEINQDQFQKLRYIMTEVLHKKTCSKILSFPISEKHLCAQAIKEDKTISTGVGVCQGDIGGPLIFNGNTLIGILSRRTDACDESYHAGLYTRITSYLKFIKQMIDDNPAKVLKGSRLAAYKIKNTKTQTSEVMEDLVEVTDAI